MLLDLSRFRGELDRIDRQFESSAFPLDREEFRVVAPVDLQVEVRKDAKKVRLVGRVRTTLECDCSRCLEPFPVPVDLTFDLLYLPVSDSAPPRVAAVTTKWSCKKTTSACRTTGTTRSISAT